MMRGSLENEHARKQVLEGIGKKLGVFSLNDWYKHTIADVAENGGRGILRYYNNSLYDTLKHIYSTHNWEPWQFQSTPKGVVSQNRDEQLRLLRSLEANLDIKEPDDWYKISTLKLHEVPGGRSLLSLYHNSVHEIVTELIPEHKWIPWKFEMVPRGFWKNIKNVRAYLDWLGPQLGVKQMDDWYKITSKLLKQHKSASLLALVDDSVYGILLKAYPEHKWECWRFGTVPKRFWNTIENQRLYLDWVFKSNNFTSFEDWYKVSGADLSRMGAGRLLSKYQSSIYKLLCTVYPEYQWKECLFPAVRAKYWENSSHVHQFLNEMAEKLSIKQLDDWYRVSFAQFNELGGGSLLRKYGSLSEILKHNYPHHNWELNKFQSRSKKAAQRWLKLVIQKLFPGEEVMEDYDHPEARFGETKLPIELDVFIPSLGLALEYQGQQHFGDVHYFGPHRQYKRRDEEKKKICQDHKITVIEIPFWWDKQAASLAATVAKSRPDLEKTFELSKWGGQPIPERIIATKPTAVSKVQKVQIQQ